MSKKRFECVFKEHETNNCWSMIKDNQLDRPFYIKDVVALLNEQQATITRLNKQIEQLNLAIDDLLTHTSCDEIKKQNEQLRKELDSFKPVLFQDMRKGTIRLYAKGGIDE